MRLFTALDLPGDVVGNLEDLLRRLKPAARIPWSTPANLHVTTKFIGEWPEDRLGELTARLAGLPGREAIPVRIRRLGFFPNPHSPRIFWCGIEAPGLAQLAADTDSAAASLGLEPEKREFAPHLTLARIGISKIGERVELQPLREAVAGLVSLDFGEFEARSFFLYRSTLEPAGSVYTKLAEFPLTKS
jgi:2'-5' RNA ligase